MKRTHFTSLFFDFPVPRKSYHNYILGLGLVLFALILWYPLPQQASAPSPSPVATPVQGTPQDLRTCVVARIVDGDTLTCEGGERIRLLLIDTPELSQEPYGRQAQAALRALLPPGTRAGLEMDVQERDRYGRTLAYVHSPEGFMVNEEMARQGYAVVSVYPPNVQHVERMRGAVQKAREARRGLWSTPAFECTPQEHRRGQC